MKKLLIATKNPGKLKDLKLYLSNLPVTLVTLADLKIKEDVLEDGSTFEENAIKKAKFYAKISHLPTIADDGGLEIDYLNGEPGIHSRRWLGGKTTSDEALINLTLKKLKGVPEIKRGAQLRTVVVFALPNGKCYKKEGKIRGIITKQKAKGLTKGVPFRSLFYLPNLGKYYNRAYLTKEEDLQLNHRANALKKLLPVIKSELKI